MGTPQNESSTHSWPHPERDLPLQRGSPQPALADFQHRRGALAWDGTAGDNRRLCRAVGPWHPAWHGATGIL